MKKILAFLFSVTPKRRNDSLRANQFPEATHFSPWIAMLP